MTPRPAATLVLVRPGSGGPEVLMLERVARGFFGGLWVFPGGGVDEIDQGDKARRAVTVPPGVDDHAWRAAALRETVEEVGFPLTDPPLASPMAGVGEQVYDQVLAHGAVLDGARLRLLSQWVTPEGAPTRFDARFYLALTEENPVLVPQEGEVTDLAWIEAATALARYEDHSWAMVTPTIHHLRWLATHTRVEELWEAAAAATGARVEPTIESDGSEVRVRLPAAAELP